MWVFEWHITTCTISIIYTNSTICALPASGSTPVWRAGKSRRTDWGSTFCKQVGLHNLFRSLFLSGILASLGAPRCAMPQCAIYGCNDSPARKSSVNSVKFYRFPRQEDLKQKWVSACQRIWMGFMVSIWETKLNQLLPFWQVTGMM